MVLPACLKYVASRFFKSRALSGWAKVAKSHPIVISEYS